MPSKTMPPTAAANDESRRESDHDRTFAVHLMQYLVVPTFVLDADCKVLIWNKACERLTGVLAADVVGTREHWRAFYDSPRPCLADLVAQGRMNELDELYAVHSDQEKALFGVHAENWCVMPQVGTELYLAIDTGPIFDEDGTLLAVVETLRDMTEQRRAQIALEQLATCDGLTGIANRRRFDEALSIEWKRGQREHRSLSLLMIDVDYFKRYNDTYGHQAGDCCLQRIAKILQQLLYRPGDLVARYGGEEFAVILSGANEQGAALVARRLLECIAVFGIPHKHGVGGIVTLSIGVATVIPPQSVASDSLIAAADEALYRAKKAGRNRFVAHYPCDQTTLPCVA